MIESIGHRGPDGIRVQEFGPLRFGHARLSILDVLERSHQPMLSADGSLALVHNGEIYNFLELADELRLAGYQFQTTSDTEVILAAYQEWGFDCVRRFNGIWAFALWDSSRRRLLLSRDRLGVKPLFLARDGARIAFASEIKALLTLPWIDRTPHPPALHDFLIGARLDHGRETFFRNIERLPPGCCLVIDEQTAREHRYWDPPSLSTDASAGLKPEDACDIEAIRAAIIDSVSMQLRSDVALGSCLSGGLDSSTIVAVACALRDGRITSQGVKHHERDRAAQHAFFADFPDPDITERRHVDEVVASTGVILHTASPTADEALQSLEPIVKAQDEPFVSTSIVAQYHVMRLARRAGVPVLLDGQGADELLGGYAPYRSHRDATLLWSRSGPGMVLGHLRGRRFEQLARILWSVASNGGPAPSRLRPSRHLRPLLGELVTQADGISPVWVPRDGTNLAKVLWRSAAWESLPSLLRYEDRNSMAFGLEARVPFLDHRVVELALALPDRLRINEDVHKVALRHAFPDLVPELVRNRRDKIGFVSPERRWIEAWAPVLRGLCDAPRAEQLGILKPKGMRRAFDLWATERLTTDVFWRVLNVEMWSRVVVRGESLPF